MSTVKESTKLHEISKKTLGTYLRKAHASALEAEKGMGENEPFTGDEDTDNAYWDSVETGVKRKKGIERAMNRLTKEDVEPLSEISKKTLGSYVKKGTASIEHLGRKSEELWDEDDEIPGSGGDTYGQRIDRKLERRRAGVEKAVNRLTKEDVAASIHAMILEGRGRKRKDGTSAEDADRLGIHAALLKHKDQGERGHGFIQFASGEKIRLSPGERDAALHKINSVVYSGAHRPKVHDFLSKMDGSKAGFHAAMQEDFDPNNG